MGVQSHRQVRAALSFVLRPLLLAVLVTVAVRSFSSSPSATQNARRSQPTQALVIASTSNLPEEATAWISQVPADWAVYKYVADAPPGSLPLTVPVNKGNEAMVYLTYIVDHYDALPDVVFFHHAHRTSWHQALDSLSEVAALRTSFVRRAGFASARCLPGCENLIPLADHAVAPERLPYVGRDVHLTTLLASFLQPAVGKVTRVPGRIAAPCCAQFAASSEAIRARPRQWWVRLRQWLIDTPLDSQTSGRLFEHTWHIWLGQEAEYCPGYDACRCHVFGMGSCQRYFEEEETM
ncbi:hypothetical protein VTK73DRAFT_3355 [Phialemonium thermophilum]|uniref:Uncharacterized protein n=1 Tax=Phialemonium thermophilum TaxID=223376 RepID=A0ABR3VJI7_9PEZI